MRKFHFNILLHFLIFKLFSVMLSTDGPRYILAFPVRSKTNFKASPGGL